MSSLDFFVTMTYCEFTLVYTNLRLQETGKLDQRTSTAVESLLSLRGTTTITGEPEAQWRPLSPASSVGTESATFSPTRVDPPETNGYVEADHCLASSPDTSQSSRGTVCKVVCSLLDLASYCMRLLQLLFTCVTLHHVYV